MDEHIDIVKAKQGFKGQEAGRVQYGLQVLAHMIAMVHLRKVETEDKTSERDSDPDHGS